jgi:hypothetical protein
VFRRSSVEVTWHRTRGTAGRDERVVVRRDGGPEQTFGSLAELPQDVQQMVEGFFRNPEAPLPFPPQGALRGGPPPGDALAPSAYDHVRVAPPPGIDPDCPATPAYGWKAAYLPMPLFRPSGIDVSESGGVFRITYRWFSVMAAAGGLAGAVLCAWPLVVGGRFDAWWAWLLAALAVLFAYAAAAYLVNRTVFEIYDGRLTVCHGPLPWVGARSLERGQIEQLCCRLFRSRYGTYYRLSAITVDGRQVRLLNDIGTRDQALYLEQQIEQRLGIVDRPVPGELMR